eukprot:3891741-Amphidinium_carterae.1
MFPHHCPQWKRQYRTKTPPRQCSTPIDEAELNSAQTPLRPRFPTTGCHSGWAWADQAECSRRS